MVIRRSHGSLSSPSIRLCPCLYLCTSPSIDCSINPSVDLLKVYREGLREALHFLLKESAKIFVEVFPDNENILESFHFSPPRSAFLYLLTLLSKILLESMIYD